MKNLFKFTFLLIFLSSSLHSNGQLTFGLRAGVNFANVNIETEGLSISPDNRVGLTLGGLLNIGITEKFSVQPELQFTQKGYNFEFEFIEIIKQKISFNYFEVPVLAKYKFGEGAISGFIQGGPSFGYALSGNAESCTNGDCDSETFEFDDNDGFNRFDLGLSIGGGLSLGKLFVDLRYNLSVTNLSDDTDDEEKIKHKGFQIGVGYMFGN